LTPLSLKEQAFFRAVQCPVCRGTNHTQFVDPERPFAPGAPLPTTRLRCKQCQAEFDPYTNLVSRVTSGST
jgi:C4-type Zn-finger protein